MSRTRDCYEGDKLLLGSSDGKTRQYGSLASFCDVCDEHSGFITAVYLLTH